MHNTFIYFVKKVVIHNEENVFNATHQTRVVAAFVVHGAHSGVGDAVVEPLVSVACVLVNCHQANLAQHCKSLRTL